MAENEEEAGGFVPTIALLADGKALEEFENVLRTAVLATGETRKKSTVTFKLTVQEGARGMLLVGYDEPVLKLTKTPREATHFFATEQGGLVRQDPAQKKIPFSAENVTNFNREAK